MASMLIGSGWASGESNTGQVTPPAAAPSAAAAAPAPVPTPQPPTGPRPSFNDGTIRFPAGETAGYAVLTVSQLSKADMAASLALADVTPAAKDATVIQFDVGKAIELQAGGASRSWLVPVMVSGLPVNSAVDRYAQLKLGDSTVAFGYSLSNRTATAVEFGVSARPQWVVSDNHLATAVTIDTREQSVAHLRIAQTTLSEQALGQPIELQSLELCVNDSGDCQAPPTIPARDTKTLYLRIKAEDRHNGVYKGSVSFAADGRPEPKPFVIDVLSSSACAQIAGAVVILLSVVWAWLVIVRGKLVVARLSALAAAATLRESLQALLNSVGTFEKATNASLAKLRAAIERYRDALTEQQLKPVLPRTWAFYETYDNTKLKAALADGESQLRIYTIVVQDGVEPVGLGWNAAAKANQAAAVTALNVGSIADEAAARTLAQQANDALAGAPGGGAAAQNSSSAATIIHKIEWTNFGAWVTYLLLVSISGITILILRSPGFGTWLDFVYCLFWGFGLPTTLDKLQQMTPSGIATSISVNMPK